MKLLDLGDIYVSDFIDSPTDYGDRKTSPLALVMDDYAPRLTHTVDPDQMYGKYWYHSGTNTSMSVSLRNIVEEICERIDYKSGDTWLDIACNDGTLLSHIPYDFGTIGIDPVEDSFYQQSKKVADVIVKDYFSKEAYYESGIGQEKCKVITTIAMFYDLDDPTQFIQDVYDILDDDGIWVIQMAYSPLMIQQMAFDNICHEHIWYHSLSSMTNLMLEHDFKIVDVSVNDTNGGSFRLYLQKNKANISSFGSAPFNDVCNFRTASMYAYELDVFEIDNPQTWIDFGERIDQLRDQTVGFIRKERSRGKSIYGYGASTKGNTLLQYFGLNNDDILAIAERSPEKFGKYTVGSNIPIIPEDEMRKEKPDYLLILPWHFIREFTHREKKFLDDGGKFIVPCPNFEVIG